MKINFEVPKDKSDCSMEQI